jgi:hypothetical protein
MNNTLSLISLVKDDSAFVSQTQNRIAGIVAEHCHEVANFESFTGTKELLKGLSASFSHSKIVVVCAQSSHYLRFKNILFQALSLETEVSDLIVSTIAEHTSKESDITETSHALVPKGSSIFLSDDGLFSGFSVESGKQHLIVLPLDSDRIEGIIGNGFTDFLKVLMPADKKVDDVTTENNAVTKVLDKLVSNNLCFAIAANKTSAFIKTKLSATGAWENSFKFLECDEEKKFTSQKELIAGLAHQAQIKSGCTAGIAISNVFTSDKEEGRLFVLVTVADNVRARVAKVYAKPEENAHQLVFAAVEALFIMVNNYVDAGGFTGFPVNQDNADIPHEEKVERKRLTGKLFVYITKTTFVSFTDHIFNRFIYSWKKICIIKYFQ